MDFIGRDGLYWVADESGTAVLRGYLASALAIRFPGFDDVRYPDWDSLLRRLGREAARTGWHGPLVIDEQAPDAGDFAVPPAPPAAGDGDGTP